MFSKIIDDYQQYFLKIITELSILKTLKFQKVTVVAYVPIDAIVCSSVCKIGIVFDKFGRPCHTYSSNVTF